MSKLPTSPFRAVALVLALMPLTPPLASSSGEAAAGRALAFARDKGNCLACHQIAGGTQMGTLGPPLVNMRQRYPDRQVLAAKIHDATANNPASLMPPFGRHRILTTEEIAAIVDFLYGL